MANCPSETSEQISLVNHLNKARICFCSVPNGGLRDKQTARVMVAEGAKKGVPDLLIFDPPPLFPDFFATFLEMKVRDEMKAVTGPEQVRWHEKLHVRRWKGKVCYGSTMAIEYMRLLGYNV